MPIRLRIALIVAAAILLVGLAPPQLARGSKIPAAMLAPAPAEKPPAAPEEGGFTLGKLLDSKLLILVQPPLPPAVLDELTADPHRSGMPRELLAPGDTGVTVRLRW